MISDNHTSEGKTSKVSKTSKNNAVFLIAALFIIALFFGAFTYLGKKQMLEDMDNDFRFVRSRIERYDIFNANDKVKSLTRLQDKTVGLSRIYELLGGMDVSELDEYADEQRLDGAAVLDDELNVVSENSHEESLLVKFKELIYSDYVRDIISHPNMVYTVRLVQNDGIYDFAAVKREDAPGIVITYAQKGEQSADNGDLTLNTLFTDFAFKNDGAIVIAENDEIVSSNLDELVGMEIADDSLPGFEGSVTACDDSGIFTLKKNGRAWYGCTEKAANRSIFVLFPQEKVYLTRNLVTIAVIIATVLIWLLWALLQSRAALYYQDELKKAAEDAQRANAAKTDFLRRMSHDLRTPINGIMGLVNISRHYAGNEAKQEECREKIISASGFLLDLVNNVLDMNKLESGTITLEHKSFDLKRLIAETNSVIEIQANEHGINFSAENVDIEHSGVIGSPVHLRQIIQNIESNAIRYNNEGGYVRASYKELKSEDGIMQLQFICADNGIGMSEEFQKHAFEPFAQENDGARTRYAGTGLGLAITQELVMRMGGEISLHSNKNVGSTFEIIIPLCIDSKPAENEAEDADGDAAADISGARVLLVEDNELNMEIAEFTLKEAGAVITRAYNGREAVDIFAASAPGAFDCILMDSMMPVMGGCEAAELIRSMDRSDAEKVPIFAMTANAFSEDIEKSMKAGMNEHLTKPINADKLIRTIGRYYKKE